MSGWLSRRLVERGIIKEEEQEIYQFGIRNGMIIMKAIRPLTWCSVWSRKTTRTSATWEL